MKKLMLTGFALAAIVAGPAFAADMPLKAPPPVYYTWTGFYFGGNFGWAHGDDRWCTDATFVNCLAGPFDVVNQHANGVAGGGQIGYRWQWSPVVFGVEAMLDGLALGRTDPSCVSLAAFCGPAFSPNRVRETTFNNIASVTGSLGWAWDRTLLYAKGGWAEARMEFDANLLGALGGAAGPQVFLQSGNVNRSGWTAGVGLEYAVANWVSMGLEYDYYGFGTPGNMLGLTNTIGVAVPCSFCNFGRIDVQTVTARVNFHVMDAWFR
jgi:outer membrane immunogenic protein